jgi:hypothetical protein
MPQEEKEFKFERVKERLAYERDPLKVRWQSGVDNKVSSCTHQHQILILFPSTFFSPTPFFNNHRDNAWQYLPLPRLQVKSKLIFYALVKLSILHDMLACSHVRALPLR